MRKIIVQFEIDDSNWSNKDEKSSDEKLLEELFELPMGLKYRKYYDCDIKIIKNDVLIRDEMDADLEDSGLAQGEIESCLNHWNNKYLIVKK